MIKLLSLKFVGIGRFVDEQTIDFTTHSNLIQVDGKNLNTGGSSGAGKSTIFHALDFLLGICETPTTALQSRGTKTQIEVQGVFDFNGKKVTITRGKKVGLIVDIENEQKIENSAKIAEEKIDELIGIPRKLFKKMFHKRQKEGGFFLNLTAKESYELLVKVLGLEKFTDKITEISEKNKIIEQELNKLLVENTSLEGIVATLKSNLSNMTPPQEPHLEDVGAIKQTNSLLEEKLNEAKKTLNLELDAIVKPVIGFDKYDDSCLNALNESFSLKTKEKQEFISELTRQKNELENRSKELNKLLSEISLEQGRVIDLANEVKKLKTQKLSIESSICPTCAQGWVGDSAKNSIITIENKIKELTDSCLSKYNLISKKPDVERELGELSDKIKITQHRILDNGFDVQLSSIGQFIADEKAKIAQHNATIANKNKSLELDYNKAVMDVNNKWLHEINKLQSLINDNKNKINSIYTIKERYNSEVSSFNKNIEFTKNSLTEYEGSFSKIDSKFKELKKKKAVGEEAVRLIKNYTLKIFQDSLDYIGGLATQNLSKIPNMSNSSIYFESCKETKSGSIRDEIAAIINMDGENEVNIKTLSGGERTAIDLAVDLALIDMMESKVGKGFDIFILDEPFNGLDHICIEQCLDMLRAIDGNKRIVIVDHSSEVKAAVYDIITVERNGENSNIK